MQSLDKYALDDIAETGSLKEWAKICRQAADRWWHDPVSEQRIDRNDGEMFILMCSEVCEAMEGCRKDLMDDKLPHRKSVEVELADLLIRVFDYAAERKLDLDGAVKEKLLYNAARQDHTLEARRAAGGKKW